MIAKGPAGGGKAIGPKPGTPARANLLARHVNNLTSSNYVRQQKAEKALARMNLTPEEHMYVQSKVGQPKPPKNFSPRSYRPTKIGGGVGRNGLLQQINEKPPSTKNSAGANQRLIPATRSGVGGPGVRDGSQLGFVANELTGYKAIENIGHDPLGGGLALAGLLPFGKVGKLGELAVKGADAIRASRTSEEAAAHIAEATAEAKAMGHGDIARKPTEPPRVGPETNGKNYSATGGALGKQVRDALAGRVDTTGMGRYEAIGAKTGIQPASRARETQNLMYSAERAKRAGKAAEAMKVGGQKGYHAALGQLKGQLPKVDFQGFKHLDQQTLDAMMTHVQQHPNLRTYDKITAMRSLAKAAQGKVPTASEQKILHLAFGADATKQLVDSIPFWKKAKGLGLELLNVPRALMASFDLSAPFRQGLVAGVTHPGIFSRNLGTMLRSFKNEHVYQGVMNGIYDRSTFPLMQKAKLALTDIGVDPHAGSALSQREEQFMSNLAERIPGIGHGVRASDRAYTAFLNKTRADLFDHLVQQAAEQGLNIHDQKVVESIAKFVNSATGRGDLGAFQKHAVTLNTLLFSPRLLMSRFNFMNPLYYARLDPFARKQAIRAALNLVATMGVVLGAAKAAGASVNTDPTNADFAKIKIGNTRIDMAGGFQQPIRLLAQLAEGKITSSTTGKVIHLGPQGVGHLSRKDIAQRFIEGKLAPVPSVINDLLQGTTFAGQPLNPSSEAASHLTPLVWQDMYGIGFNGPPWAPHVAHGHGQGPGIAALLALPDLLGIGVQNYSAKKKTGSGSSSYGGSSGYGSGSGYGGGSGYGSGSGYGG